MAQMQSQSERQDKISLLNQLPVDFAETAKKRFKELADVQTELFERFQEANKRWLDRAQAEANFASEFVSRLSSARSIPDVMTAYQYYATRRFEMMADDAKHVLDDTQKFMQMGAHMASSSIPTR